MSNENAAQALLELKHRLGEAIELATDIQRTLRKADGEIESRDRLALHRHARMARDIGRDIRVTMGNIRRHIEEGGT